LTWWHNQRNTHETVRYLRWKNMRGMSPGEQIEYYNLMTNKEKESAAEGSETMGEVVFSKIQQLHGQGKISASKYEEFLSRHPDLKKRLEEKKAQQDAEDETRRENLHHLKLWE
jgi:hypothetical protein